MALRGLVSAAISPPEKHVFPITTEPPLKPLTCRTCGHRMAAARFFSDAPCVFQDRLQEVFPRPGWTAGSLHPKGHTSVQAPSSCTSKKTFIVASPSTQTLVSTKLQPFPRAPEHRFTINPLASPITYTRVHQRPTRTTLMVESRH